MTRRKDPLRKLPAHIAGQVTIAESGCWEFTGYRNAMGYGAAPYRGRRNLVHRLSYEAHNGEIPAGLVIDHLCRNKACCNPEHLEAVTQAENTRRADTYLAASEADHGDYLTQAARRHGVPRHTVAGALVAGFLTVAKRVGPVSRPVRLLLVADVDAFFAASPAPSEGVVS